uniref:SFRICE_014193 n=1 Tax=Spodoptera frugiperda TaxID=7108 RepID=A0A2H1VUR5_SPOFR
MITNNFPKETFLFNFYHNNKISHDQLLAARCYQKTSRYFGTLRARAYEILLLRICIWDSNPQQNAVAYTDRST